MPSDPSRLAAVFGLAGEQPTADERALLREARPVGICLFRRNIADPEQLRRLTAAIREAAGEGTLVLVDQEGGRVARLRPPHWPPVPAAARFGRLYEDDPERAVAAARANGRLIGAVLAAHGLDVAAAPVLDLVHAGQSDVVGDRSFGTDPACVAALGRATAEGLLDAGVLPVIKHLPGHGRARVDSHFALPRIDASPELLEATDFEPFRRLADLPCGMTGHLLLTAFDTGAPATLSPAIVAEVIRGRIGFDGLLFTDDLCMGALEGGVADRAIRALAAGCDVALHCDGDFADMRAIAETVGPLSPEAARRLAAARARIAGALAPVTMADALAERDRLLGSEESART